MARTSRLILSILVVVLPGLAPLTPPVRAAVTEATAVCTMYSNREFTDERYSFTPRDTMYVLVTIIGLEAGDHILTTDWINPLGGLERQEVYSFSLDNPGEEHRFYSWLRLWKKGFASRTFTGMDYDLKHYGQWRVAVFLNGTPLASREFTVN